MASIYGKESYAIDHKGRVSIPASMRREVSRRKSPEFFMLAPGLEGSLVLYPPDTWQELESKLRALPYGNRDVRLFLRGFLSETHKVTVDSQGRVTIPPSLMARAELSKDAVLHGLIDRIEIWNPKNFDLEQQRTEGRMAELYDKFLGGHS